MVQFLPVISLFGEGLNFLVEPQHTSLTQARCCQTLLVGRIQIRHKQSVQKLRQVEKLQL